MVKKSNKPTINEVLESLSKGDVLYEIEGDTVYFGYDLIGSSFFFDRKLQRRIDNSRIDFLKVVRAIFLFFDIKSVNPSSIWLKCKIREDKKLIQIVEIDSNGSFFTKKLCISFLENFQDLYFGHFSIIKNPFSFEWHTREEDIDFLLENFLSLDESISRFSEDNKKKFFQFLEKSLILNGQPEMSDLKITDCRSFLIKSSINELRIFRN
tara:strand:- start:651 stop:1280 length:630 start_codon:yes stop_codon:yes gene_type:complete